MSINGDPNLRKTLPSATFYSILYHKGPTKHLPSPHLPMRPRPRPAHPYEVWPRKRPKLALEMGFRSLDREFLETSVLNHSPNCPDLDYEEIHNGLQKKLPGFLRMRGLCVFKACFKISTSQTLCTRIIWGSCEKQILSLLSLGWGSGFCISNKIPGDACL